MQYNDFLLIVSLDQAVEAILKVNFPDRELKDVSYEYINRRGTELIIRGEVESNSVSSSQ